MNIRPLIQTLLLQGLLIGFVRAEQRILPSVAEGPVSSIPYLRGLPSTTKFELLRFSPPERTSDSLHYYLYHPAKPVTGFTGRLPLVVVLHHAGAESALPLVLTSNPESIGRWLAAETQSKHPGFVVAPWSGGKHWESGDWHNITPMAAQARENAALTLTLIDALLHSHPVDPKRIYLVGQSMGAFGVWDLIARRPNLFAAAVPVCGGGDPGQVSLLKEMPLWTFHGSNDTVIPVERTRAMAKALEDAGSRNFRYWEYRGARHDQCSERAFSEPSLVEWLFNCCRP